jgi:hypothetical protein
MTDLEKCGLRVLLFWATAWMVMLAIGVVHAQVLPAVNAVGFGPALVLTALGFIGYLFTSLWASDELN